MGSWRRWKCCWTGRASFLAERVGRGTVEWGRGCVGSLGHMGRHCWLPLWPGTSGQQPQGSPLPGITCLLCNRATSYLRSHTHMHSCAHSLPACQSIAHALWGFCFCKLQLKARELVSPHSRLCCSGQGTIPFVAPATGISNTSRRPLPQSVFGFCCSLPLSGEEKLGPPACLLCAGGDNPAPSLLYLSYLPTLGQKQPKQLSLFNIWWLSCGVDSAQVVLRPGAEKHLARMFRRQMYFKSNLMH